MIHEIDFERGILALAPLAGFTDLPFRSVVKKFVPTKEKRKMAESVKNSLNK